MALAPLLLVALVAGGAAAEAPSLEFVSVDGRTIVELWGLDSGWARATDQRSSGDWSPFFAVYTREAYESESALPPLLGSYHLLDSVVRFTPRFPMAPGTAYVALWRDPEAAAPIVATHIEPRSDESPSAEVLAVYPSTEVVPANLLRLYVQFSAPMSEGKASEHIRLLDEDGQVVRGAFVAPERELWSPDGTRLTLFFDPGRIKRGVGPNQELGPPLRLGRSYRLVVDRALVDARGASLTHDYDHAFRVAAADREQPTIDSWELEPPLCPRTAVRLSFPEPLDRGLLEGLLIVLDPDGSPIPGTTTIEDGDAVWSFMPTGDWGKGVYRIRVDTLLEDLAGNSLRRPFEIALATDGRAPSDRDQVEYVDLPFSVRE